MRLMMSSGTGGLVSAGTAAAFFAVVLAAGAFSGLSAALAVLLRADALLAALLPADLAGFLYLSRMTSTRMNLSQAWTKAFGVFSSPMPMTYMPLSRRRMASGVKSLSELTRT